MDTELRELCERLRNAFDYMDAVNSDYARQVAREIADGILDTIAAQAAELEGVRKDAERLDWLELFADSSGYLITEYAGATSRFVQIAGHSGEFTSEGRNLRAAIDTAIADSGAGGGG